MSHYIEKCDCGEIISQCRCPDPNKEVRITSKGCDKCKGKSCTPHSALRTPNLQEFGSRLIPLNTGAQGIRAGIHTTCREVPGDAPMMDFIGSDDSIDRYNERIDQDGWQLDNFRANPVIPDCHNYSSVACILGRAVSVGVANNQLTNRVEFALDNPLGAMAYKMAKGQFIKAQSVGFIPLEWTNAQKPGEPDRTYTKAELLEVSLVVVPANPGATNNLKAALKSGAVTSGDLRDVAEFFKQFMADIPAPASASGGNVHDAQLLGMARNLKSILQRA